MLPRISLSIERWKWNKQFEIWVSNKGHFRNREKKPLAPKVKDDGYLYVYTYGSNPRYTSAHRVVMHTWRPTIEAESLTVDHLDHNKRNNALTNLEWVTRQENQRRAQSDQIFEDGNTVADLLKRKNSLSEDTKMIICVPHVGEKQLSIKQVSEFIKSRMGPNEKARYTIDGIMNTVKDRVAKRKGSVFGYQIKIVEQER